MKVEENNPENNKFFKFLPKASLDHSVVVFNIAIYKKLLEQKVDLIAYASRRDKQKR